MKVLIDEDLNNRRLAALLRSTGHDVILAMDVGLLSVSDARVLAWAVRNGRAVVTRDHGYFGALHDLVMIVGGHHPGIPVVRFDDDPRNNLTDRGIATTTSKLESAGVATRYGIHVPNHWR